MKFSDTLLLVVDIYATQLNVIDRNCSDEQLHAVYCKAIYVAVVESHMAKFAEQIHALGYSEMFWSIWPLLELEPSRDSLLMYMKAMRTIAEAMNDVETAV